MKTLIEKLLSFEKDAGELSAFSFPLLKDLIGETGIETLEASGALVRESDLSAVWCEDCHGSEGEPIEVRTAKSNGQLFYVCGQTGRRVRIKKDDLKMWKLHPDYRKAKIKQARLIEKDAQGDFLFDGKIITMGKGSEYCLLFEILLDYSDQNGFLSYENIEKFLIKSGLVPENDTGKRNKRIQNLLHQGIFRYAKVQDNRFYNGMPNGKPVIEIRRGRGLILNNPRI